MSPRPRLLPCMPSAVTAQLPGAVLTRGQPALGAQVGDKLALFRRGVSSGSCQVFELCAGIPGHDAQLAAVVSDAFNALAVGRRKGVLRYLGISHIDGELVVFIHGQPDTHILRCNVSLILNLQSLEDIVVGMTMIGVIVHKGSHFDIAIDLLKFHAMEPAALIAENHGRRSTWRPKASDPRNNQRSLPMRWRGSMLFPPVLFTV